MAVLTARRLHALAGVAGAVFLLNSAATGLLWSNAQRLYWRGDDYKKKKAPAESPALSSARIDARRALAAAGLKGEPTALTLRGEAGRLVYEVQAGKDAALVDAVTGKPLSPLDEELAGAIADQYAPRGARRTALEHREAFVGRDGKKRGPVWAASYAARGGMEIVLDDKTGAIVEEYDPSRRFHFWVMRLHKLDFFHTDKALTAIPGALLLAMTLSGLWLWQRTARTARSASRATA